MADVDNNDDSTDRANEKCVGEATRRNDNNNNKHDDNDTVATTTSKNALKV